jgi:phytoene dehydrogenase-like protein
VISILAHFAPFDLEGGWSAAARDTLRERALDQLEQVAPRTRARILACQVLTPADIAETWGIHDGHLHHGEPALDQLLSLRPPGGLARHATPIHGLFLGGAGTHPGGGVTGLPGWLAADRILART